MFCFLRWLIKNSYKKEASNEILSQVKNESFYPLIVIVMIDWFFSNKSYEILDNDVWENNQCEKHMRQSYLTQIYALSIVVNNLFLIMLASSLCKISWRDKDKDSVPEAYNL